MAIRYLSPITYVGDGPGLIDGLEVFGIVNNVQFDQTTRTLSFQGRDRAGGDIALDVVIPAESPAVIRDDLSSLQGDDRLPAGAIRGLDVVLAQLVANDPTIAGARNFVSLSDAPSSYTGEAFSLPMVSRDEDELEFKTIDELVTGMSFSSVTKNLTINFNNGTSIEANIAGAAGTPDPTANLLVLGDGNFLTLGNGNFLQLG